MHNMEGVLLNNRYEIVAPIGMGGSGSVYIARDVFLNSQVAIKRVSLGGLDQVDRLKKEYLFLKNIDHPNLVKAHEFFFTETCAYIVLEYIKGKSLGDIIAKNKYSMSLVGQLAIASQIARGIEVLNTGGIIHRDIKPHNIMVDTQTGEVKIVDLGTAKNLNSILGSTAPGAMIGTCCYMSPEQTKGEVTWSTDIFSLGVLLYQFFTWSDESPFATNNIYATIKKIRTEKLIDICSLLDPSGITPKQEQAYEKISEVLIKALQKEPEDRWQNCGALADFFIDIRKPLLGEVSQNPQKYKIETSRRISQDLRERLEKMRTEYSSVNQSKPSSQLS